MRAAILRDGERNCLGEWRSKIRLPTIWRDIRALNIVPEWLWNEMANIFSSTRTSLDEDPLARNGGWSGSLTACRSRYHKIGIGCLAQIDIGQRASIATKRHLASKCKQRLE